MNSQESFPIITDCMSKYCPLYWQVGRSCVGSVQILALCEPSKDPYCSPEETFGLRHIVFCDTSEPDILAGHVGPLVIDKPSL